MREITEIATLTSRHGTVTVTKETTHSGVPMVYVVTGSSGYRAVLPACWADECLDGTRTACPTPDTRHSVPGNRHDAEEHFRSHCHYRWHDVSAERFARDVLSTYGASKKRQTKTIGVPRGPYHIQNALIGGCAADGDPFRGGAPDTWPVDRVAEALGVTVDDYRAELRKAR